MLCLRLHLLVLAQAPDGVRQGLERVRMLPAVNGGPRTHMSCGPFDHKAYKGDWLLLRKVESGRTVFVDYHDPALTTPPGARR